MNAVEVLETLELIGASQRGLVTTGQATEAGLTKLQVARLADRGVLERVRHGVYALPSAGVDPLQELRAAWLSATLRGGKVTAATPEPVVVCGASAAAVHQLGDVLPNRHEFATTARRQTAQPDVHFRQAALPNEDVTMVTGLPVTTVSRTVSDLVEGGIDRDHLRDVLRDAVAREDVPLTSLSSALDAHARDFDARDGAELLTRLAPPPRERVTPLVDKVLSRVDFNAVGTKLAPANEAMGAMTRKLAEEVLRNLTQNLEASGSLQRLRELSAQTLQTHDHKSGER